MTHTRPVPIGQQLPDLPLLSADGDEVTLGSLRGEATLLIFLRHLG
jgi:peroxiredoxin